MPYWQDNIQLDSTWERIYNIPDEKLIISLANMHKSLKLLESKNDYIIRKNELKDQEQMAHIKIDGWKDTYDKIIASKIH